MQTKNKEQNQQLQRSYDLYSSDVQSLLKTAHGSWTIASLKRTSKIRFVGRGIEVVWSQSNVLGRRKKKKQQQPQQSSY